MVSLAWFAALVAERGWAHAWCECAWQNNTNVTKDEQTSSRGRGTGTHLHAKRDQSERH